MNLNGDCGDHPHAEEPHDLSTYEAGRQLMEADRFEDAIRAFSESSASRPHYKTAELLGECYLRLGQPASAILPLAAAVGLGRHGRACYLLARALLEFGDRAGAREQALLAIERQPDLKRARQLVEEIDRGQDRADGPSGA